MELHFDDSLGMSQHDIEELCKFTKLDIPENIVSLFKKCSGGRYNNESSYCYEGYTNGGVFVDFHITLVETKESIIKYWELRTYLDEYMEWFNLTDCEVEPHFLFPVFRVLNGAIYVAVGGKHCKSIFYTDIGEEGILKIAESFEEFCSKLVLRN